MDEGIGDSRMKSLLEVGHIHSARVDWRTAADHSNGSIALVHIKDQIGRESVPFGSGEINLPKSLCYLDRTGYSACCVVEMEVADKENTLTFSQKAPGIIWHGSLPGEAMMNPVRICIVGAGSLSTKRIYPYVGAAGGCLTGYAIWILERRRAMPCSKGRSPMGLSCALGPSSMPFWHRRLFAKGFRCIPKRPPDSTAAEALSVATVSKQTGVLCTPAFKKR